MQHITSPRYRAMLEDMVDPIGQYDEANRSQMAQSVIAHMLNGGMRPETIEAHLLDSRNALSSWARVHKNSGRMRSEADALKHIRDSIHKSVANPKGPNYKPAIASQTEASQLVGEWKMLLEECVWGGRRTSLLSVLSYMGGIATKTGSVVITVSSRQLAEECGIGHVTATRAINKAAEEGWLKRTERPARQDGEPHLLAPAYRLSRPQQVVLHKHARSETVATVVPGVRATVSLCVDQDAFAWMGLGKSAARVYGLLKQQGLTHDQLAALTGFHRDTLARALTRLTDSGLVVDVVGTYITLALDEDLDRVAEEYGVAGTKARKQAMHRAEREAMVRELDRRRIDTQRAARRERIVRLVIKALGPDAVIPDHIELIDNDTDGRFVVDLTTGEMLCAV